MVVDQQNLAEQLGRRPVQHPDGVAEQRRERLVVEDDDDRDLKRAPIWNTTSQHHNITTSHHPSRTGTKQSIAHGAFGAE